MGVYVGSASGFGVGFFQKKKDVEDEAADVEPRLLNHITKMMSPMMESPPRVEPIPIPALAFEERPEGVGWVVPGAAVGRRVVLGVNKVVEPCVVMEFAIPNSDIKIASTELTYAETSGVPMDVKTPSMELMSDVASRLLMDVGNSNDGAVTLGIPEYPRQ